MSPAVRRLVLLTAVMAFAYPCAAQDLRERTVYVSVLDRMGRPVREVSDRDVTVFENGAAREVLRVSPVTDPFDIAVLVDTSGVAEPVIPDIRRGLLDFLKATGDRHEIALIGFGQRPTVLVDYTRDPRRLETGIGRIFAQTGSGAYLMDGLVDVSRGLRSRERARRQILVITTEGQEFSTRVSRDVLAEVSRSGAVLDAFVIANSPGAARGADVDAAQQRSSVELPDHEAQERALVLDEGPRMTGGRREDLVTGMALGSRLRDFAAGFNQFLIVYEGAANPAASASIEVLATRPELRVQVRGIPPK